MGAALDGGPPREHGAQDAFLSRHLLLPGSPALIYLLVYLLSCQHPAAEPQPGPWMRSGNVFHTSAPATRLRPDPAVRFNQQTPCSFPTAKLPSPLQRGRLYLPRRPVRSIRLLIDLGRRPLPQPERACPPWHADLGHSANMGWILHPSLFPALVPTAFAGIRRFWGWESEPPRASVLIHECRGHTPSGSCTD